MYKYVICCKGEKGDAASNYSLWLSFSKDPANVAEENDLSLLAVGCDRKISYIQYKWDGKVGDVVYIWYVDAS